MTASILPQSRICETTTTAGTGNLTLGGVLNATYRPFNGNVANASKINYLIEDVTNGALEEGFGTFTSPSTISRDTIVRSSNGNSIVTLAAGTKIVWLNVPPEQLGGCIDPGRTNCRIGLDSSDPRYMSDKTAQTTLYALPDNGDVIALPTSWGDWAAVRFSSLSILATDSAQTGNFGSTQKVITNLTTTVHLVRGMKVTGTNIGAGSKIASIDSSTQVTLDTNTTGTGSGTALTFKLPANTQYYAYMVLNTSGAAQFQLGAAGLEAVSRINGVLTNTSVIASGDSNSIAAGAGKLLGIISTTGTDGQLEDSATFRGVANWFNTIEKKAESTDTTGPSTSSTTYVQVASVQFSFVTFANYDYEIKAFGQMEVVNSAESAILAIGSGATTLASGCVPQYVYGAAVGLTEVNPAVASLSEHGSAGLITRYLIFRSANGNAINIRGDLNGSANALRTIVKV